MENEWEWNRNKPQHLHLNTKPPRYPAPAWEELRPYYPSHRIMNIAFHHRDGGLKWHTIAKSPCPNGIIMPSQPDFPHFQKTSSSNGFFGLPGTGAGAGAGGGGGGAAPDG